MQHPNGLPDVVWHNMARRPRGGITGVQHHQWHSKRNWNRYKKANSKVSINSETSEAFKIKFELRQGC